MSKVVWDKGLCDGHGVCVLTAPDIFAFDDNDDIVISNPELTPENSDLIEQAVMGCPKTALKIVD